MNTSHPKYITVADQRSERAWQWTESEDALRTYLIFFGFLLAGELPFVRDVRFADLPYFVGLATITIYIGAHRGLTNKIRQQITLREGALAPVAASVALFGGYLLIKFFPDLSLQRFLNIYFWLIGSIAIVGNVAPPLRRAAGELGECTIPLTFPEGWLLDDDGNSIRETSIAPSDIAAVLLGLGVATVDLTCNHSSFTLNNLIACLIATDILQLLGLKSFKAAAVMLVGLAMYDIFWVFGSPKVIGDNVMLAVATSDILTGPTRLLFPRFSGSLGEGSAFPFSLLGLGDVAVPGLLACLALRYDASRATDMRARALAAADALKDSLASMQAGATDREIAHAAADAAEAAFDEVADAELAHRVSTQGGASASPFAVSDAVLHQRTYFVPTMLAYVGGLGIAFGVNAVTHLGQPALLYLVPATLSAIVVVGAFRGELMRVISFVDSPSPAVEKALARQNAKE
ncbi:peptidase A22B, signal peptide peptidase [Coccomyxa subellipsoidea C-169]|uniref:Peptidase A22B, signal peptide peptidase n=1 Tax=Coccomyxa subellipsoidea (strain C-169) TaxID=574566 RepID=I0Z5C0_COCSC|nr:peptidase A22B, signal peptide peptidase [Coccomyxa subellipsoidea C-169]EIE25839.1 peptidase A22B, signal peptide peptidase [Coccomyxa subellipsoidea C-169]|eukprot:XP_005650383.1 peptidase A22B, signal peptide peptidase [Coccomyxa subellipsoidea C-169]